MTEWIKLQPQVPVFHTRVLALVLAALLPIQLPVSVLKAEDNSGAWTSNTHIGNPNGALGSWFQSGPALCHCGHLWSEPGHVRSISSSQIKNKNKNKTSKPFKKMFSLEIKDVYFGDVKKSVKSIIGIS